ncbi:MAG: VCBS repeat-containing protein, partial [Bdellovibrionales bacterium]|nr:VCBS repeat-containing protein [Bdellovibrionales bacterium]
MRIKSIGLVCSLLLLSACSGLRAPVFQAGPKLGNDKEWRQYPVVVDFDQDGDLDIVATHRRPLQENSLHIFLGDGAGNFRDAQQSWPSPGYSGLAIGDIDGDQQLDVVAASHFNRVHTLIQDRNLAFDEK